jgi:hypothetical protein
MHNARRIAVSSVAAPTKPGALAASRTPCSTIAAASASRSGPSP